MFTKGKDFLKIFFLVFLLIVCFADEAKAISYVFEKPIIGDEIEFPEDESIEPQIPQDGYSNHELLLYAYKQDRAVWYVESGGRLVISSIDGKTIYHDLPYFYEMSYREYIGASEDHKYIFYNKSYYDEDEEFYFPRIYAVDIITGKVSLIRNMSNGFPWSAGFYTKRDYTLRPRKIRSLSETDFLIIYELYDVDDTDWERERYAEIISLSGNYFAVMDTGYVASETFNLDDIFCYSILPDKNKAFFGFVHDYNEFKFWKYENGKLNEEFSFDMPKYGDYDVYVSLYTYNDGYILTYREHDDDDDEYTESRLYKDGELILISDGSMSVFHNDKYLGAANTNGSRIYDLENGDTVYSADIRSWPGDVLIKYYDKSRNELYIHKSYDNKTGVEIYIYNLLTLKRTNLYDYSMTWADGLYITEDNKFIWSIRNSNWNVAYENYWFDMNDRTIHTVIKNDELAINYSPELNKFYAYIGDKYREVTFSPITSISEITEVINEQIKESMGDFLKFENRGYSDDDFNTKIKPGIYAMGNNCPNAPEGGTKYYSLLVMQSPHDKWVQQVAIDIHSDKMFMRRSYDNNGSRNWNSWKEIWNSASDGSGSGLDADKLDGADSSTSASADTIVKRDSSGDISTDDNLHFKNNDGFYYNDTTNTMYVKIDGQNYKIWHEANDGSGSGLDADKIDGKDSSYFAPADTAYPIIKKVEGKNGATATTSSTFTVVIEAIGATEYKVTCGSFDSGWTTDNEITITGLNSSPRSRVINAAVRNSLGNIDEENMIFFILD